MSDMSETLMPSEKISTRPQTSAPPTLRLSQVTAALGHHIDRWPVGEGIWLSAEVARCERRASGHWYLTLVEKAGTSIVARVEAIVWERNSVMLQRFEQMAGHPLSAGNQARVLAQFRFHPAYGLALVLQDIEPLHPLGELERQRRAALMRLQEEGLLERNKAQFLSVAPQRILVVSSETAAGYDDFQHLLRRNPQGYAFSVCLVPAILQGRAAAASLLAALRRAERVAAEFDALVILRGGGGAEDLHPFNDYALAAALARFPLPVLTGIGHERDATLADRVAHTSLPTPTGAANFLIERMQALEERFHSLQTQIETAARDTMRRQKARLQQQAARAARESEQGLRRQERKLQAAAERVGRQSAFILARQENRLAAQSARVVSMTSTRVHQQKADLMRLGKALSPRSQQVLRQASAHLESLRGTLRDRHPRQILKRGYCLVRRGGRILLPLEEVEIGNELEIETLRGRFIARVEQTEKQVHGATASYIPAGDCPPGTDRAAHE